MVRRYAKNEAERLADRAKLDAIRAAVLAEVPGAAVAADQAYREADLAIDFCEDVPPLPPAAVERIVAIFERFGAIAKVSSIHVNGWFGGYDKLSTSRQFLREAFGMDIDREGERDDLRRRQPERCADVPVLRAKRRRRQCPRFRRQPAGQARLRDEARGAAGFVEFADALLAARLG